MDFLPADRPGSDRTGENAITEIIQIVPGAPALIVIPVINPASTTTRRMSSVATDQKTPYIADEATQVASPIENELPTYRAISKSATISLLCGILASFAFAYLFFLVFAVLAVCLGILANRGIRRHPDMLTGRGMANAGIALGIIFGLVVTTYTSVQTFVLTRDASQFGERYAEVLQKGSFGDLLWYGLYPDTRKEKTPEQALQEFESTKAKERMLMDQKMAPLQGLKKHLTGANAGHLHFVDIESHGVDESWWPTRLLCTRTLRSRRGQQQRLSRALRVRVSDLQGNSQRAALRLVGRRPEIPVPEKDLCVDRQAGRRRSRPRTLKSPPCDPRFQSESHTGDRTRSERTRSISRPVHRPSSNARSPRARPR